MSSGDGGIVAQMIKHIENLEKLYLRESSLKELDKLLGRSNNSQAGEWVRILVQTSGKHSLWCRAATCTLLGKVAVKYGPLTQRYGRHLVAWWEARLKDLDLDTALTEAIASSVGLVIKHAQVKSIALYLKPFFSLISSYEQREQVGGGACLRALLDEVATSVLEQSADEATAAAASTPFSPLAPSTPSSSSSHSHPSSPYSTPSSSPVVSRRRTGSLLASAATASPSTPISSSSSSSTTSSSASLRNRRVTSSTLASTPTKRPTSSSSSSSATSFHQFEDDDGTTAIDHSDIIIIATPQKGNNHSASGGEEESEGGSSGSTGSGELLGDRICVRFIQVLDNHTRKHPLKPEGALQLIQAFQTLTFRFSHIVRRHFSAFQSLLLPYLQSDRWKLRLEAAKAIHIVVKSFELDPLVLETLIAILQDCRYDKITHVRQEIQQILLYLQSISPGLTRSVPNVSSLRSSFRQQLQQQQEQHELDLEQQFESSLPPRYPVDASLDPDDPSSSSSSSLPLDSSSSSSSSSSSPVLSHPHSSIPSQTIIRSQQQQQMQQLQQLQQQYQYHSLFELKKEVQSLEIEWRQYSQLFTQQMGRLIHITATLLSKPAAAPAAPIDPTFDLNRFFDELHHLLDYGRPIPELSATIEQLGHLSIQTDFPDVATQASILLTRIQHALTFDSSPAAPSFAY